MKDKKSILEYFNENGYIVLEDVLNPIHDFQPVKDEYSNLLDECAADLFENNKISSYDPNQPLLDKLLGFVKETSGLYHQHFDISLPLNQDIQEDSPMHLGSAVLNFIRNKKLLDVVEMLIGPEIYVSPVQHTRIKPPENYVTQAKENVLTAQTFWHQDLGVIDEEGDGSDILTVFVPFTELREKDGCILVVPGSHRKGLLHHCRNGTLNGIPPSETVDDQISIPMKPGDILILHRLTIHASLPNIGNGVRWSFDLRYLPTGQPTGRRWFPGFVARSRINPELEITDHKTWVSSWHETRSKLAKQDMPKYTRWGPSVVCDYCK